MILFFLFIYLISTEGTVREIDQDTSNADFSSPIQK